MEVGQRFTVTTYNTRTITSGNTDGVEAWAISHIKDDVVTCELISTNMSMYSGDRNCRGVFNALFALC